MSILNRFSYAIGCELIMPTHLSFHMFLVLAFVYCLSHLNRFSDAKGYELRLSFLFAYVYYLYHFNRFSNAIGYELIMPEHLSIHSSLVFAYVYYKCLTSIGSPML